MKNRFFEIALQQASRLAGKSSRIMVLLTRLGSKMGTVNWTVDRQVQVREKFFTVGRLAKAYALGHYRDVPWRAMLALLAAVIYFLNPLDLIPDIIPVFGLTDDFAVLIWVYNAVGEEIEKFLLWEESKSTPI
ncbi:MAG: YkvA family protein [Chryseolinea sp.]